MKIICLARNYVKHAEELNNPLPEAPIFFFKPDSAIIHKNKPFYYPDFSKNIHYEAELILKIDRLGKKIAPVFAHRYYGEIGIGIDFTARDLQNECKQKGLPWEISKGFDGSAVIGKFIKKEKFLDINNIHFKLEKNGETVQKGNSKDMIFPFYKIVSYVSKFVTLKMGDLIFTGTPAGVGPVKIGDRLIASIEDEVLLDFCVKN